MPGVGLRGCLLIWCRVHDFGASCLFRRYAGRSRAAGGIRIPEEWIWDTEYIVDIFARAEIAVNHGVTARRALERVKPESMQHGCEMLENGILNGFVGKPSRCVGEAIDLERYSGWGLG